MQKLIFLNMFYAKRIRCDPSISIINSIKWLKNANLDGFESEKCQIFWIFTKFEDQGPEYDKDLGPGPPLRTVWPVPVQDRDSPSK